MSRKALPKRVILPGLMWDGEAWVPFSKWAAAICFTDKVLAEILCTNQVTVGQWRQKGMIPFVMEGSFARYNICDVIEALKKQGYRQDSTKKAIYYETTKGVS
jgi:hypothetical protein